MSDNPTCASCRFWHKQGSTDAAAVAGWCARYAPRPVVQPADMAGSSSAVIWPETHAVDWCGEHAPREPERSAAVRLFERDATEDLQRRLQIAIDANKLTSAESPDAPR